MAKMPDDLVPPDEFLAGVEHEWSERRRLAARIQNTTLGALERISSSVLAEFVAKLDIVEALERGERPPASDPADNQKGERVDGRTIRK